MSVNKKNVMIDKLLTSIYIGNYNSLDTNKIHKYFFHQITVSDLEKYLCDYVLNGTKKEMLMKVCLACHGIDSQYISQDTLDFLEYERNNQIEY